MPARCRFVFTTGRSRRRCDSERADLRERGRADRGDHPAPGLGRGRIARDARPRQGGAGPRRVLRKRARGGEPGARRAAARGAGGAARGIWCIGAGAMSTFERLADLPLEVEGYTLEGLRLQVSSGFERRTTVVHLRGGGLEGVGEDVVYQAEDHAALQEAGPVHEAALRGSYVLGDFCELVDGLDLYPVE